MTFPSHGDEAKPSSVIPERPTAPSDGGMRQLEKENAALRNTMALHAGDCLSLENEIDGFRRELAAADALNATVRCEALEEAAKRIESFYLNTEGHILDGPTLDVSIAAILALAASAPSCPVGEKELENCVDLSGTNQQEPRSSMEVAPCPFCSSTATLLYAKGNKAADCWDTYVSCDSCGANGPTTLREHGDDEAACCAEAIEDWNRRAAIEETTPVALANESATQFSKPLPTESWRSDMENAPRDGMLVDLDDNGRTRDGKWKLVPVEPDETMMNAGLYQSSRDATWADVYSSWKDMVEIAREFSPPASPLPTDGEK